VGLGVAAFALLLPDRKKFACGYVAAALLSVNEWLLKPVMTLAHERGSVAGWGFGAWHGVSAVVYVAACVALIVRVWRE
jgi:hypothetical protein